MLRSNFDLPAAVDVKAKDDQHGMEQEELIGHRAGKSLFRPDAGAEDRWHGQGGDGADDAAWIHERQQFLIEAAVRITKAGIEDKDDLNGAQMQRQIVQFHVWVQVRTVT